MPASARSGTTSSCSTSRRTRRRGWIRRRPSTRRSSSGSPLQMVPMIRNILGGFLFSGDDVYKHVRVLSGGERTRLAVARMLLRPSNTLLLDEPTNHLDLDSKEVLLDALVDYGGTLIFVSHDRYFVERLATKIIEIGDGTAVAFPGTYKEFLWHKEHAQRRGGPQGRGQGRIDRTRRERQERAASAAAQTAAKTAATQAARSTAAPPARSRRTTRRNARTPRRARSRRPRARGRRESRRSRPGSPRPRAAIREVEAADVGARVSTRIAPPPSRSSTAIRR